MKHIVVVYSHSGKALALAQTYAKEHNADLHRIEPKFDPQNFFAYVWFGYKATFRKSVKLKEDHINLKHYDHMTLFSPIHAGKLAAPVRSYLFTHRSTLPKVDIIVTHSAKDNDYKEAAHLLEKELIYKFNHIDSIIVE